MKMLQRILQVAVVGDDALFQVAQLVVREGGRPASGEVAVGCHRLGKVSEPLDGASEESADVVDEEQTDEEKSQNDVQRDVVRLEEVAHLDVVGQRYPHEPVVKVFGVVDVGLPGCGGRADVVGGTALVGLLDLGPAGMVFHRIDRSHQVVVDHLAVAVDEGQPQVRRQQGCQRVGHSGLCLVA